MLKITTLAAVTMLAISAQAQLVTLEDLSGNIVNEQTITVTAATMEFTMEQDLISTLNGSVNKTVNVKRYELNVVPGTQNYFCWGVCLLPTPSGDHPLWYSVSPQDMTPGVEFTGFHSYYQPAGIVGTMGFRFVWFDTNDTSDSTWVDVYFDTEHVGMDELSVGRFEIYPNPAVGSDLTIEHAVIGSTSNTALVMYNALGDRCFAQAIDAQGPSVRIKAGSLPAGVYLATIEDHGHLLATRVVVIASR